MIQETADFLMKWNKENFAQVVSKLEDVFTVAKTKCGQNSNIIPVEAWQNGLRGFIGGAFTIELSVDINGDKQRLEAVFYNSGKMMFTLHDIENDTYRELFKGYWAALSNPVMAYDYASQIHLGGDTLPLEETFQELAERLSQSIDNIRKVFEII